MNYIASIKEINDTIRDSYKKTCQYTDLLAETVKNYNVMLEDSRKENAGLKDQLSEMEQVKMINAELETKLELIVNRYDEIVNESNDKANMYKTQLDQANDEIKNLKKVSMVANLNRQVSEQARDIEMLNKRIESLQKQLETRSREKEPILPKLVIEEPVEESTEEVVEELVEDIVEESAEDIVEESTEDIVEESTEDATEELVEEEEEPLEFEAVKIGKKYYYVSNEEPKGIYQVVKPDDDVGDKIGEYDSDGQPNFY